MNKFKPPLSLTIFASILVPTWAVFFFTATKSIPYHIDPLTNVITAWQIYRTGTPEVVGRQDLAKPEYFQNIGWYRETDRGAIGNYPPGTAALGSLIYFIWPLPLEANEIEIYGTNRPDVGNVVLEIPPLLPIALLSSFVTAITMALLGLIFFELMSARFAVCGAYVAAFGTSAWSVASESLWHHGPAMMWIALAVWLSARAHYLSSGLAFGLGLITRPPVALIAAALGLLQSWKNRSISPAIKIGIGAVLGLLALLYYNSIWFSEVSVSGGYGSGFRDRFLSLAISRYLTNIFFGFFDVNHGLFLYSPFFIVLLPELSRAWKKAPPWVNGAAIGGLLYYLAILKANRFSGGAGYYGYRYPLEGLTAAAPLLMLAYLELRNRNAFRHRIFLVMVLFSILLHGVSFLL